MSTYRMRNLLLVLTILVPVVTADAAKPHEERRELEQQVAKATKILRAESMGSKIDRREYFEPLLAGETVADEVYWQAGFVKQDDRWVPYDGISFTTETQEALKEYAEYRAKFWGNDEEHLQIAQWCVEKGLYEQARAHLMTVLLKYPDNEQLRTTLGYAKIDGQWTNAEEFAALQRGAARQKAKFEKWSPKIVAIRDSIASGNPLRTKAAISELHNIRNADAIPAIESILLFESQEVAIHCVNCLREIDHRYATLALCRAGLFSPWINVKLEAVEALSHRPLEHYVGELLSQTRSEATSSIRLIMHSSNENYSLQSKLYDLLIASTSEAIDSNDISLRTVEGLGLSDNIGAVDVRGTRQDRNRSVLPLSQVDAIDRAEISITGHILTHMQAEAELNEAIVKHNDDIFTLLRQSTDQQFSNNPSDWWTWWLHQTDVDLQAKGSRLIEVHETDSIIVSSASVKPILASCFTAGTPVWSEFGSRPIESLKIGDRVLTKHVDTGELTYRPVIRTTYRVPDRDLIRLSLENDSITATSGHLFWVSGSGWIKARDLKPGHRIHTPTGTVEVGAIEEVPAEPVYNLVVDGFHTYFVGEHKALCHDTTLVSPTDAVVPGLVD